jgi:aspartyl-tRNA(Asn)/glutamyl-tRNA(Gln) amidotransferase subunit C
MSAPVNEDTVLHLARLARLHIEKEELPSLASDLGKILGYVAMLDGLDTTGVEPTAQVQIARLPQREDAPRPGVAHDVALAESPKHNGEGFRVPAFVEE